MCVVMYMEALIYYLLKQRNQSLLLKSMSKQHQLLPDQLHTSTTTYASHIRSELFHRISCGGSKFMIPDLKQLYLFLCIDHTSWQNVQFHSNSLEHL